MDRESIEKEYQQTCIEYGHTSQELKYIEQQEYKAKEEHNKILQAFKEAKEKLETKRVEIELKWNRLRDEIKQVESGDKASEQL